MKKINFNFILKPTFLLVDIVFIFIAFIFGWFFRFGNYSNFPNLSYFYEDFFSNYGAILIISIILWTIISLILNLQHVPRRNHSSQFWKYFVYPQFLLIFIILFSIVFINLDNIPRLFLIYFFSIQFCLLWVSRKVRKKIVIKLRGLGYNYVRLLVLGDLELIDKTKKWMNENPQSGFYFSYNFDFIPSKFENNKQFALAITEVVNTGDYLLIQPQFLIKKDLIEIIDKVEDKGGHIFHLINNESIENLERGGKTLGPHYVIKTRYEPLKVGINIINKRIIDFFISVFVLVIIYWWLFILVGIIIKFKSSGPIIFKQKRVGKNGDIFKCLKFRTMHIDSTNSKEITKVGDSRIFSFGQFLRKTNIDEFPQFINVLKGEMSIVGPRPHMLDEDHKLANNINKYRLRYWVRPGITGLAAILGYRGGTEKLEEMQTRINLDIKYIETWSFLLDAKIIFKTALEMISGNSKGH